MTVRFAVLGAGRIGQVHAKAIDADRDATLVSIADAIEPAAQSLADFYGAEVRSIDAIAVSDDIDAVVICTPTDMHADLIEQFGTAGKAVFCEKPIDLDVDRVRTCLQCVADTKATLMVAFQRRFDPDFMALKERIDSGVIGEVEMVVLTSRDPAPPPIDYIKRSGGLFRDMAIHDLDVARWLLEEPVVSVQAAASVLVDPAIGAAGDFDTANIVLTTASGRQATINNSRRAGYGYDQRIEVFGSKGMVSALNTHESNTVVATADGYTQPALQDFFMTRYERAYANEIAAFVQCVKSGSVPNPSGDDGLKALILADAAMQSVAERRTIDVDIT